MTLADWGVAADPQAPRCSRRAVKQSPTSGKIAGFLCRELTRDLTVYATMRTQAHYYRKGHGYAISESIIQDLDGLGVTHVFIHGAEDSADVLEYVTRQWSTAEMVPAGDLENPDDPQRYVREDDARTVYPTHTGSLYERPFRAAMNEIDWRGYDPRRKQPDTQESYQ